MTNQKKVSRDSKFIGSKVLGRSPIWKFCLVKTENLYLSPKSRLLILMDHFGQNRAFSATIFPQSSIFSEIANFLPGFSNPKFLNPKCVFNRIQVYLTENDIWIVKTRKKRNFDSKIGFFRKMIFSVHKTAECARFVGESKFFVKIHVLVRNQVFFGPKLIILTEIYQLEFLLKIEIENFLRKARLGNWLLYKILYFRFKNGCLIIKNTFGWFNNLLT